MGVVIVPTNWSVINVYTARNIFRQRILRMPIQSLLPLFQGAIMTNNPPPMLVAFRCRAVWAGRWSGKECNRKVGTTDQIWPVVLRWIPWKSGTRDFDSGLSTELNLTATQHGRSTAYAECVSQRVYPVRECLYGNLWIGSSGRSCPTLCNRMVTFNLLLLHPYLSEVIDGKMHSPHARTDRDIFLLWLWLWTLLGSRRRYKRRGKSMNVMMCPLRPNNLLEH